MHSSRSELGNQTLQTRSHRSGSAARAVLLVLTVTGSAHAVEKDWRLAADGFWSVASNWLPNGNPGFGDDVFIGRNPFAQGFTTTVDIFDTIADLHVSNGSALATGGEELVANGTVHVDGNGSFIFVDLRNTGDMDGLDVEGMVIENDATVSLRGGILELERGTLENLTGSTFGGLGGFGTIELIETGLGGAQVFNNSGRLFVGRGVGDPSAVTLRLTNTNTSTPTEVGDGWIDLDGDNESGIVDVDDEALLVNGDLTLVVDAELTDDFSGQMLIGKGDTVDMQRSWSLGFGEIEMNGHTGTSTLTGAHMTMFFSTINVNSGTGLMANDFTLNSGSINVGEDSTLHLGGTANIHQAEAIQLTADSSALRVTGATTIDDPAGIFDWANVGNLTTTTVAGSGQLTIDVDQIAPANDSFFGTINLDDDGSLSVTVADNDWVLAAIGRINKNQPGMSTIDGSAIDVKGRVNVNDGTLVASPALLFFETSQLNVATGATAVLAGDHEFLPGSQINIDGTLQLDGDSTWRGPQVTGTGTIINDGVASIFQDTHIQVGTFKWDEGDTTVFPGKTLLVDVASLGTGDRFGSGNTITVASGTLDVRVADGEWELGDGQLQLWETAVLPAVLDGDDLVVSGNGEIQVSGLEVDINAPMTLREGTRVLIESPAAVELAGTTTLDGGDIAQAVAGAAVAQDAPLVVTGDSSISVSRYDWDASSTTIQPGGALRIDVDNIELGPSQQYDNVLTLNDGVVDVRTSDGFWIMDGTLNMSGTSSVLGDTMIVGDDFGNLDAHVNVNGMAQMLAPVDYNSDARVQVEDGAALQHLAPVHFDGDLRLNGGELAGAVITNDGVIHGHGLITAQIINNNSIEADGGTLVLANDDNSFSGATFVGQLIALSGSLQANSGSPPIAFAGTARIGQGHEIFMDGTSSFSKFSFQAPSHLELTSGTWRSTHRLALRGDVTINPGSASMFDVAIETDFRAGANVRLDADLQIASDRTMIDAGVTFAGDGTLINLPGSTLQLGNAADVGVTVDNRGVLELGDSPGTAFVGDFVQTVEGTLDIELAGTEASDFDQLFVSGAAQLDGTLDVTLLDSFMPALGDAFSFLSAPGGITGTFASANLPALGPGLELAVVYSSEAVALKVVEMATNPDFNMDGTVDQADIDALVAEIVNVTHGPTFDLTGDGIVNHDDLDQWLIDAGAINLPSGNAYLTGDANLDGVVDGGDFLIWNSHKFTTQAAWSLGDFTADGAIDGQDFIAWNTNKFMASQNAPAVPEPRSGALFAMTLAVVGLLPRSSRS